VKRKRSAFFIGLMLAIAILFFETAARADDVENVSYVERGFVRILGAAFQLPRYLIQKTFNGPPILGTVDGVITGAFYTVSELTGGVFDIARGTIPYAKYLIFFV